MSKKNHPKIKIGEIKLTSREKEVIAENMNSEFFKIITTKIMPQRLIKLSLMTVAAAQDEQDLWFYKGRYSEVDWLKKYLNEAVTASDEEAN